MEMPPFSEHGAGDRELIQKIQETKSGK